MKNVRHLIINADGYGFTPGVNRGIVDTFAAGTVKSTSCTPNFGYLHEARLVQERFPHVSFGIHFNLNVGRPCARPDKVRSLINDEDAFYGADLTKRLLQGRVKLSEIQTELAAQAAMLADQGVKISHWDGHQNRHLWPIYFECAAKVAKRFNIPGIRSHRRQLFASNGPLAPAGLRRYYSRNPKRAVTHLGGRLRTWQAQHQGFVTADRLVTPGYADHSHKSLGSFWSRLADTLPTGWSEVYCHPGYPDDLLRRSSQYTEPRAREAEILSDPAVAEHLERSGIALSSFWDLRESSVGSR